MRKMKKMKKILSVLLGTIMVLSVVAGCAPKPQEIKGGNINIAALKGPTAMGIVSLLDKSDKKETKNTYSYEILGSGDEVVAKIVKGELDIAMIPANLASVLYNNTKGEISVIAINNLGVVYIVDTTGEIKTIADLKGKEILAVGKGTTPEFTLNHILAKNGLDVNTDLKVEYKGEATEVAATLLEGKATIAMLPQPFVSTVLMKNDKVKIALDLTKEWETVNPNSSVVTGVIIVRNEFLKDNKDVVDLFLEEYKVSADFINKNVDEGAALVEKYGISPAPVAKMAIPLCNIRAITGADMQSKISSYLEVLFNANPKSVGGKLPDEKFYYLGK